MPQLLPSGKQQYFDDNGIPLVGGQLFTYALSTTTPLATTSDAAGLVPNTNPIILNARGEAEVFWNGNYSVTLEDASGNLIWSVDGLDAIPYATVEQLNAAIAAEAAALATAVAPLALSTTVAADVALLAPLASPTFTGTPAAPTPATTDSSTLLATTAFVQALLNTGVITGTVAGNGDATIPILGLQLRWGEVAHSAIGNQSHSFSKPFKTGCYVVLPVCCSAGVEFFGVVDGSLTANGWTQYSNNTTNIMYLAIGH